MEKDRASWVWATPEISPVSSGTPMSHMVSRDTEIRGHFVGVGVQSRHQDHVRLVVAAVRQGGGGLLSESTPISSRFTMCSLITVIFSVVQDGVAVQLLRAAGG